MVLPGNKTKDRAFSGATVKRDEVLASTDARDISVIQCDYNLVCPLFRSSQQMKVCIVCPVCPNVLATFTKMPPDNFLAATATVARGSARPRPRRSDRGRVSNPSLLISLLEFCTDCLSIPVPFPSSSTQEAEAA